MFDSLRLCRWAGLFAAASVVTSCVTPKLPEPTLSLLKAEQKYYIQSIDIDADWSVKSFTILDHIKDELNDLPTKTEPVGQPMKLRVTITKLHDVNAAESFLVGGINSINANFSLVDPKNNKKMFEMPLDARSANYAPGGLLGALVEAATDDEPKLARALIDKMEQWVLIEHELTIQKGVSVQPVTEAGWVQETPESRKMAALPPKPVTIAQRSSACDEATSIAANQARETVRIIKTEADAAPLPGLKSARMLIGPEIKRLFKQVGTIGYPNSSGSKYNDDWTTIFSPDGTVESTRQLEGRQSTGNWRVRANTLCVEVTGGNMTFGGLYAGCVGVHADPDKGVISAVLPKRGGRFVMAEDAFGLLASLAPKRPKTAPRAGPSADCEPANLVAEQRPPEPAHKFAAAAPQLDREGYRRLTGPEIKKLFNELKRLNYPGDGKSIAGNEWAVSFLSDGSVDAASARGSVAGSWRIIGDMQCVELKREARAGTVVGSQPFEGCFAVFVKPENGVVAASMPDLNLDRFVMAKNAYREIAGIAPLRPVPAKQAATLSAPVRKGPAREGVRTATAGPAATPPSFGPGFHKLTGPQIRRLFKALGTVAYPNVGSAKWSLSFSPDGTFEGRSSFKNSTVHGIWRVAGNRQCIEIKGGNAEVIQLFEGCFEVSVDAENGVVAAKIPELNLRRFVMSDSAFGPIGTLAPVRSLSGKPAATVSAPALKGPGREPVRAATAGPAATPPSFGPGFHKLTGPQIKRLFKALGTVDYPDDGSGFGSAEWSFFFSPDGTFEGSSAYKNSTVYGIWGVTGNRQCIEIKGGNPNTIRPFEGCFTVSIDAENGVVAANIPELKLRRFVMSDSAFGPIGNLAPGRSLPGKPAARTSRPIAASGNPQPRSLRDSEWYIEARRPAAVPRGYRRMTALHIKRVFSGLDTRSSRGNEVFLANGKYDYVSNTGKTTAWGKWRIRGDKFCIKVAGYTWNTPPVNDGCYYAFSNGGSVGIWSRIDPAYWKLFGDHIPVEFTSANPKLSRSR